MVYGGPTKRIQWASVMSKSKYLLGLCSDLSSKMDLKFHSGHINYKEKLRKMNTKLIVVKIGERKYCQQPERIGWCAAGGQKGLISQRSSLFSAGVVHGNGHLHLRDCQVQAGLQVACWDSGRRPPRVLGISAGCSVHLEGMTWGWVGMLCVYTVCTHQLYKYHLSGDNYTDLTKISGHIYSVRLLQNWKNSERQFSN